jgi:hypothetical protein
MGFQEIRNPPPFVRCGRVKPQLRRSPLGVPKTDHVQRGIDDRHRRDPDSTAVAMLAQELSEPECSRSSKGEPRQEDGSAVEIVLLEDPSDSVCQIPDIPLPEQEVERIPGRDMKNRDATGQSLAFQFPRLRREGGRCKPSRIDEHHDPTDGRCDLRHDESMPPLRHWYLPVRLGTDPKEATHLIVALHNPLCPQRRGEPAEGDPYGRDQTGGHRHELQRVPSPAGVLRYRTAHSESFHVAISSVRSLYYGRAQACPDPPLRTMFRGGGGPGFLQLIQPIPHRRQMVGMFIGIPALLSLAGPPPRQDPDSVPLLLTRMALDVRIDYERQAIGGSSTLVLRNLSDRPVASVPLLLNRLMVVSRVVDETGANLHFDQHVVVFRDDSIRQVNAITITPGRSFGAHDSLALTLQYGGILVGYTETGSLYIQDHVAHDFTILREDAYAFPVLGMPSWASVRAIPTAPFVFTAQVTVPADLVVAMGGELLNRARRDSLTTWCYRSMGPVPFLNITVAPYLQREGPATLIFYFPADSAGARMLEEAVAAALDRYRRWYGPLRTQPQLVIMEIPVGFGSQASLTAGIIQTADAFRTHAELRQVYHELSHLWNIPDLEHPSPRWNEGLASFLQWRMAAELDGWNEWDVQVARAVQTLLERCAPPAPCNTIPFGSYGTAGLTDRSYSVGFLMFYTLYQVLGGEHFDQAYRHFVEQYRDSGATTAELEVAFHRESPLSDAVFADWLATTRWYARLSSGESIPHMIGSYASQ